MGRMPPRAVLWPLASLTSWEAPSFATVAVERGAELTRWRITALTDRLLVRVTASAPIPNWELDRDVVDNHTGQATLEQASAIGRSQVTGISVVSVDEGGTWTNELTEWSTVWRLHIGAEHIDLPASDDHEREASEALARSVLQQLS
jgi:hypothetical protein